MEGIDALNSWKSDLGNKIRNYDPQRPKRGQKSIGQCVCMYPPSYATISLRVTKSETYKLERVQQALG